MPNNTPDRIRTLCRKRIAALPANSPKSPASLENPVVVIVQRNLASGRFERLARVAKSKTKSTHRPLSPLSLADYIDRVLFHVSREKERIDALERGDAAAWTRLRELLARRAMNICRRYRKDAALAQALDFADEACVTIFEQLYPFDVSFEAWATTILKNLILGRYTRSTDAMDRNAAPDSLDAPRISGGESIGPLSDLIADRLSDLPFERIENQTMLVAMIERLHSRDQRRVIVHTYFEELDDAAIARQLGRSKQAVYNLRQRALVNLKEIWVEIATQEKEGEKH